MEQLSLIVNGIDHIGLDVKDLARAKRFYTDFLGMEPVHDTPRMSFLRCGAQMLTLVQVDGQVDDTATAPVAQQSVSPGMNHLALRLQSGDYEQVCKVLQEAGHQVRGRRGDIYFSDPDGYEIQLILP